MLNEIKSLPPLPHTVIQIQEMCMNTDTDIDELTRVIEHDPMLSANILKSVNSPLYGMSKEISSIHQAIMLFGIFMIRGFAASSAIKKSIATDLGIYSITIDDLTNISSLQMALAREWYRNVNKSMLPLLQGGAFLMELGKLITSLSVISMDKLEQFKGDIEQGISLEEAEKSYCTHSSYEIVAMMFEHWNFESALIDALREISNPLTQNPYAQVLRVITQAVNVQERFGEKGMEEALKSIETFGLNKEAFEEAVLTLKEAQKG